MSISDFSEPPSVSLSVCVDGYNSVKTELEREKVVRLEAETKQKELQASEAQLHQKLLDLEAQLHDLEAAKVSNSRFTGCYMR